MCNTYLEILRKNRVTLLDNVRATTMVLNRNDALMIIASISVQSERLICSIISYL